MIDKLGRSIPACAGEPPSRHRVPVDRRVYPRVCGGTRPGGEFGSAVQGLSPRVRGNQGRRLDVEEQHRSIPACAGEPFPLAHVECEATVYPRVCGGTEPRRPDGCLHRGLSPRVRGNPMRSLFCTLCTGSIPACAGEPRGPFMATSRRMVYPRVCGGTPDDSAVANRDTGLSPRVRGNRVPNGQQGICDRSIPACAGEPFHRQRQINRRQVYPRVCGGTSTTSNALKDSTGLSPRVRGNPAAFLDYATGERSIPACAGEPDGR